MTNEMIRKVAALTAEQLPEGVFLCVGGDTPNVMTVGWGGLTYFWKKYVFIAPIRQQRHTYPILDRERAFTVSIPAPGSMAKELALAGTLSGRDGNKFAAIGLETAPGRSVSVPTVAGCHTYLECVVRAQNAFTKEMTDTEIIDYTYQAGDFHVLYFGEIVNCYTGETK